MQTGDTQIIMTDGKSNSCCWLLLVLSLTEIRGSQHMISEVEKYLDTASSVKKEVRSVIVSGLGVTWVVSRFRTSVDWLLVSLSLVVGIAAAESEMFPANIIRPVSVVLIDVGWEVLGFGLILTHVYLSKPGLGSDLIRGLLCFIVKVIGAHVIEKAVQRPSAVETFIDHFNAITPALVAAARPVLSMTSKQFTRLPHSAAGEPFESLVNRRDGLNS